MERRMVWLLAPVGVAAVAMLGWLARAPQPEVPVYWDAPAFALTDQEGRVLRREDLAGTVWIADFIFTHCPDVCPMVTARMARLRDSLAAEGALGSRVRLVSFSVDPARDTPEVLRAYAADYGAPRPAEWAFLTGPVEEVHALIEGGFKVSATPAPLAAEPAADAASEERHDHGGAGGGESYTVIHSDHFMLVDAAGRVRGVYSSSDPEALERLHTELRAVLREQS